MHVNTRTHTYTNQHCGNVIKTWLAKLASTTCWLAQQAHLSIPLIINGMRKTKTFFRKLKISKIFEQNFRVRANILRLRKAYYNKLKLEATNDQ